MSDKNINLTMGPTYVKLVWHLKKFKDWHPLGVNFKYICFHYTDFHKLSGVRALQTNRAARFQCSGGTPPSCRSEPTSPWHLVRWHPQPLSLLNIFLLRSCKLQCLYHIQRVIAVLFNYESVPGLTYVMVSIQLY